MGFFVSNNVFTGTYLSNASLLVEELYKENIIDDIANVRDIDRVDNFVIIIEELPTEGKLFKHALRYRNINDAIALKTGYKKCYRWDRINSWIIK